MNECLTTPQHKKQIGYWVSDSRSVFCAGVSLNIHSFSLQINHDFCKLNLHQFKLPLAKRNTEAFSPQLKYTFFKHDFAAMVLGN